MRESWPLRFTIATYLRLVFFGLFFIAPAVVVPIGMLGIDVSDKLHLGHAGDPFVAGIAGLALLTSMILPAVVLKMRDPGPSRVDLDDWGATEWDGDGVRTAIPWAEARVYALDRLVDDRRFGTRYRHSMVLSVAGRGPWSIYAMWGSRISLRSGPDLPNFARRRRAYSAVDFQPENIEWIPAAREKTLTVDPRDERRGLFRLSRALGFFFIVMIAGAIALLPEIGRTDNQRFAAICFGVAAVVMLLRCLRPRRENRLLAAEGAPCSDGSRFVLAGEVEGGLLRATSPAGSSVLLDLAGIAHPDRGLQRRICGVHVATAATPTAQGPYRGDVPLRVLALETDRDRRERARITRANRIELSGRILVSLMLSALAVVVGMGWQVH